MESSARRRRCQPQVIEEVKIEDLPVINISHKYREEASNDRISLLIIRKATRFTDMTQVAAKYMILPDMQMTDSKTKQEITNI